MKIYDCFLFFNELDLLELRLELLNDVVDYFVISECDYTFSGNKKPFYFEENKRRFSKFLSKIIHIKNYNTGNINNFSNPYSDSKEKEIYDSILSYYNNVKNTPETDFGKPHWCRDFFHRELVKLGMVNCEDDDVILFGDLDEIPNPDMLDFQRGTYICDLRHMVYSLNLENVSEPFQGTIITKYENIKNKSLGEFRNVKRQNSYYKMSNSGWHLTSMGGVEGVRTKILNWGHQEFNNENVLANIERNLNSNTDVFGRNCSLRKVNMEECYPEKMLNLIREKFSHLILN